MKKHGNLCENSIWHLNRRWYFNEYTHTFLAHTSHTHFCIVELTQACALSHTHKHTYTLLQKYFKRKCVLSCSLEWLIPFYPHICDCLTEAHSLALQYNQSCWFTHPTLSKHAIEAHTVMFTLIHMGLYTDTASRQQWTNTSHKQKAHPLSHKSQRPCD